MISKKALLIGGGVLGGLGILWYLSQSSSSSSGTTSVDLTPPTLTLGPYPSQSPRREPRRRRPPDRIVEDVLPARYRTRSEAA